MAESTEEVTDIYSVLADADRRYVLYYLAEQGSPVSFDRLVAQVAAWRDECDPDAVDDATLAETRTALYHMHLPKLDDLGVVTYESDPEEIVPTDDIDSLSPFLEPARRVDLGSDPPIGQA